MQFAISLPASNGMPVYRQVCEALRDAIASGRLKAGDRLPSTRELAECLSLSRLTVNRGYAELLAQGYIKTIVGSGAYVSETAPTSTAPECIGAPPQPQLLDFNPPNPQVSRLSSYGRHLLDCDAVEADIAELKPELNYGAPPIEHLPLNRWRDLLNRSARFTDQALLSYENDCFGYWPLRQSIASYLHRARSIKCSPEQIAVFSNTECGLDLLARLFLNEADTVVVENPGFPGARRAFLAHRARLQSIGVDACGMLVSDLTKEGVESDPAMIYLTPAHHDPTGAILSETRRRELLAFASQKNSLIIEDDYDSEFRYGDRPGTPLFSMDTSEVVIYRYNFWRILYPLIRFGFLILPPRLVPVVKRGKSLIDRDGPLLEQMALSDFISEGHLDRHIRKLRPVYAARRAALIHALTRNLGKAAEVASSSAGFHILVRFTDPACDDVICQAAAAAGLPLVSTGSHYAEGGRPGEFLLAFAHLELEDIPFIVQRFARSISP